jgi:hypothetical protein
MNELLQKIIKSIGKKYGMDMATHKTSWKLEKFASDEDVKKGNAFEKIVIEGNILMNAGINQLWTLAGGTGATKFDNANAYLGVGDSTDGEDAADTDLQAASNKLRKGMNVSYPTYGTSQKITFQSDFTANEANYAWAEMAVFNHATVGTMLNRKISAQGTKTSGQTWRLTLEITLS